MEDVQKTLFRQSASSLKEDKHVFIQSNSRLTVYDPIFFACRSSLFSDFKIRETVYDDR